MPACENGSICAVILLNIPPIANNEEASFEHTSNRRGTTPADKGAEIAAFLFLCGGSRQQQPSSSAQLLVVNCASHAGSIDFAASAFTFAAKPAPRVGLIPLLNCIPSEENVQQRHVNSHVIGYCLCPACSCASKLRLVEAVSFA